LIETKAAAADGLTVVLPCLNEADSVAGCVTEALAGLRAAVVNGEVICADNGSTDATRELAAAAGARVVQVARRGYGSAILGGMEAARTDWILMADADGSYDLSAIPQFVAQLRKGATLVQGCRLPAGGGQVLPGAMPWPHRWIGNPVLSWLIRRWFHSGVTDVHCGMRAFSRSTMDALDLRCTGMEFASEMVIKAALHDVPTAQVPITLRPDRRIQGRRHLRTFRDGWRHLRFMLLLSPMQLFTVPGFILLVLGIAAYALALPRQVIGGIRFDVGTLLVGSLAIVAGVQAMLLGMLAHAFSKRVGLRPVVRHPRAIPGSAHRLENTLLGAAALAMAGVVLILQAVRMWMSVGYGDLNYAVSMRWLIPGTMLVTLALQVGLSSFLLSLIELPWRA
jgi:hypothetical protein